MTEPGRDNRQAALFTRRALLVATGQVVGIGVLAVKLYRVQMLEGARYSTMAESNRISVRLVAPQRGRLLDRTGTAVAGNKPNWRALVVAEQADDLSATLDRFARVLPLPDHELTRIERELRRRRRFVPITVREFLSWDEMARLEVNAPDLPGILIDVGTTRLYPTGAGLAHVVGYVAPPDDADVADSPMLALPGVRVGRTGVEKFHDLLLRGSAGAVKLEVNAVGRVIREIDRQEGTAGPDITLTVDCELQRQLVARLGDQSASAVVMDCRNGEVLAMATNPSFDPNLFDSGVSRAQWIDWTGNRLGPLIDKASAGLYAPGSTFKMVVALAGIEAQAITPQDRIACHGFLDLGNMRFHCWKKGGHGELNLHGGLKNSCDVFFYETARRTGIDNIAAMAKRFGLGVPLDIELPGARAGLVPTRAWRLARGKAWNLGDTLVHGIGQGFLQLTPLALATMVSRIATGRQVQPHLTRAIGGEVQHGSLSEDWPRMGVPEHALHAVREGMFAVVNEPGGTAPLGRLAMPGMVLAGKTGSTQVRRVSREQREHGFRSETLPWEFRPHALFVAFAPYDAPRYALSVVIEHGNAGAQAAAPLARDIMTDALTIDPADRTPPERVTRAA